MIVTCCVKDCCASSRSQSMWWMRSVRFFKFPQRGQTSKTTKKGSQLKNIRWLRAIRRPDLTVTSYTRICSLHFRDPLQQKPDPKEVPSRFSWTDWGRKSVEHNNFSLPLPEAIYQASCKDGLHVSVDDAIATTTTVNFAQVPDEPKPHLSLLRLHEHQLEIGGEVTCRTAAKDEASSIDKAGMRNLEHITPAPSTEHVYAQTQLDSSIGCDRSTQTDELFSCLHEELQHKEEEIKQLKAENEELHLRLENSCLRQKFTDAVLQSDATVRQCTGIPNKDSLLGLHDILKERAPEMQYWRGGKDAQSKKEKEQGTEEKVDKSPTKRGRKRILTSQQEFLLTLCRLRLGLTCAFMGLLFEVSEPLISSVFTTWISLMAETFGPQIKTPSLADVKKNMPLEFQLNFSNVRWLIDCTEFKTERPKTPTAQHKLYSQYKSSTTCKCLVSITPDGYINFVSTLFGGNASDRFITKESGVMDLVQKGDAIMADRGFNIRDICLLRSAQLIIPPFTRPNMYGKGRRLNREEIIKTRSIARSRIHVERAIERIKNFTLLSHTIPLSMKDTVDQILTTVCFLCNLQPALVK